MKESAPRIEEPQTLDPKSRPMGPLEEGDQALVDLVTKLPEGTSQLVNGLGDEHNPISYASVAKDKHPSGRATRINARLAIHGQSIKETTAIIDEVGIFAVTGERQDARSGEERVRVENNAVNSDGYSDKWENNHIKAQAVKKQAAEQIDETAVFLGK